MSFYEKKGLHRRPSEECLSNNFSAPRFQKTTDISREMNNYKDEYSHYVNGTEYDIKLTTPPPLKPSTKKIAPIRKGNQLLLNIKQELTSLKTEVNKIIHNDNEEMGEDDFKEGKSVREASSRQQSEYSLEMSNSSSHWKREMMSRQPEESSILTDMTQRKLQLVEDENEVLKGQLRKMKDKMKEYKIEAEREIHVLKQKIVESSEIICANQEELEMYKREVEEEMTSIKRMLQQNAEKKLQPEKTENLASKGLVKVLSDENFGLRKSIIELKQQLFLKEKALIAEASKQQSLSLENSRLKEDIENINKHFLTQFSNPSFVRCQESHINFDLSRSKIETEDLKDTQDISKTVSNLQLAFKKRDSDGKRAEDKYDELMGRYSRVVEENAELVVRVEVLDRDLGQKSAALRTLQREKEGLSSRIAVLQEENRLTEMTSSHPQTTHKAQQSRYLSQFKTQIDDLKSELQIMQQVNRELVHKIKLINEDRNKKDDFVKEHLLHSATDQPLVQNIRHLFDSYKLTFPPEYFTAQIFTEATQLHQIRQEFKEALKSD